jgi:hypothetical protein
MRLTTESSNQLQSIFGSGYVMEHHGDDTPRYLPPSEKHEFALDFEAILKALRSALSVR